MSSSLNDAAPIEKETPDSFASSVKRFAIFNSVIAGLLYVLSRFGTKGEGSLAQIRTVGMLAIGIQWLVFVHAGGLLFGNERTEKFYDLTGALTYISCTTLSLYKRQQSGGALSDRQTILALFVFVWCSRLGSFLFKRILKDGHDSRFTVIKKSLLRFLTAWTLQGLWVFITALPVFVLLSVKDSTPLGTLDYCGFGLWIFGFLFEVVADTQKTMFRSDAQNKDKFIHTGLWSISRHPNYFGEITLWTGVFISAIAGLLKLQTPADILYHIRNPQFLTLLFSPTFVYLLLNFVSGVPMLEKSSDEKFGKLSAYQKYVKDTPILVPIIGKAGKHGPKPKESKEKQ